MTHLKGNTTCATYGLEWCVAVVLLLRKRKLLRDHRAAPFLMWFQHRAQTQRLPTGEARQNEDKANPLELSRLGNKALARWNNFSSSLANDGRGRPNRK